jgi:hypothetical protein
MRRLIVWLGLALAIAAPVRAQARLLGDALIPYSAERTVIVNGRRYTGMVFHIPGRDRDEQRMGGVDEILILDTAQKHGFLILPLLKTYVPFAFPELMAELGNPAFRRSPVGHDTVNGVRTTKYRIDYTAADRTRARGFIWLSGQGVLMRLDGWITRPGHGKPLKLRMELAKLAVGPQDPALFQLPAGLVKLPSGMLESLLGGGSG